MFSSLDVSTSGLVAQRARMTVIANNLANLNTTRNEAGEAEPFQPRKVIFQADDSLGGAGATGVRVAAEVDRGVEPKEKYEPGHPDADARGYVSYPGTNMMTEMTDAMEAARSYEANLGAIEIAKDMARETLRILA
jgi:flagellar basal-body rod protein FlgC